MSVILSKTDQAIYQKNADARRALIKKNLLIPILFINFLAAILTISLEINGHSLSFYRWDWIQIPFVLHVFFTSLVILRIICKSKTSNELKMDVMASQIVPSIPDPSEIALPLSKEMNERNFVEQDLNTYSSTIHKVTTEFMGPLIIKRLPKSSKTFYITQIKEFAIAEKERSSPYLVSFNPKSSSPFEENGGIVLAEEEWQRRMSFDPYLHLHRKYEYQILQSHISVFISLAEWDHRHFEITMKDRPGVPLTTLSRLEIEFLDHRFTPPKEYTLIDAVTRGVKTIQVGFRTIFDAKFFCITEISSSDKIEELIDVSRVGKGNFFPVMKEPLSLEDAQEKLKNFALEYYNFNPKHIAFVPHLSIIVCFNLNSTSDHKPEFYIAKSNHGFEKKLVDFGLPGYYMLSSTPTREAGCDTTVYFNPSDNKIEIHYFEATQITNYPEIVTTAFRQLRERINTIESITIDALKDIIFQYLYLPNNL